MNEIYGYVNFISIKMFSKRERRGGGKSVYLKSLKAGAENFRWEGRAPVLNSLMSQVITFNKA